MPFTYHPEHLYLLRLNLLKLIGPYKRGSRNLEKLRKNGISGEISNFLRKYRHFSSCVALYSQKLVTFVCVAKSRTKFHKFQREEFLRLYKMRNPRHNLSSFFMLETFAKRRSRTCISRTCPCIFIFCALRKRFRLNKCRNEKLST